MQNTANEGGTASQEAKHPEEAVGRDGPAADEAAAAAKQQGSIATAPATPGSPQHPGAFTCARPRPAERGTVTSSELRAAHRRRCEGSAALLLVRLPSKSAPRWASIVITRQNIALWLWHSTRLGHGNACVTTCLLNHNNNSAICSRSPRDKTALLSLMAVPSRTSACTFARQQQDPLQTHLLVQERQTHAAKSGLAHDAGGPSSCVCPVTFCVLLTHMAKQTCCSRRRHVCRGGCRGGRHCAGGRRPHQRHGRCSCRRRLCRGGGRRGRHRPGGRRPEYQHGRCASAAARQPPGVAGQVDNNMQLCFPGSSEQKFCGPSAV